MLETFEKELKKYSKFADIRGVLLFNVLASFKPEDIDEKIASAKEILKELKEPIGLPTLVDEIERNIKLYDQCATACQILTWVTDEVKKEQCDCEKCECEECSCETTKQEEIK